MENNSEPLETISAEPKIAEPTQPQGTAWPFIIYFLTLLLVVGLGLAIARNNPSDFLLIPLVCVFWGQNALAMVVGGLMGRNWLEGVYLSTFALMCQFVVLGVSSGSFTGPENLLHAATIPLICLAGAFPLILFRWTVGWQLRTETMVTSPRSRITIEDLILVPASLVAFWVMAIAPRNISSNGQFGFEMSGTILPVVIVGFIVVPCAYWAFRIRHSGLRWVLCVGYSVPISIAAFIAFAAYNGLPWNAIGWVIFGTHLSTGVAMVGLQLLYSGGYRLVSYKQAAVALGKVPPADHSEASRDYSPFDLEPAATATSGKADRQASSRKRYRIAVAALLISTAIVNTGTLTYTQIQKRRALVKVIVNGGGVEMVNGKPIKISFGPATTEDEIVQFPSMPSVTSISVAGTQIASFYLRDNFNSLTSLDIRKTNLGPFNLTLRPSIEIIVSEGQFTGPELQDLKLRGGAIRSMRLKF